MARAHNIYLVVRWDYDGCHVEGAFTVKHEMASWVRKQPEAELVGCGVIRMRDGDPDGDGCKAFNTISEALGE